MATPPVVERASPRSVEISFDDTALPIVKINLDNWSAEDLARLLQSISNDMLAESIARQILERPDKKDDVSRHLKAFVLSANTLAIAKQQEINEQDIMTPIISPVYLYDPSARNQSR